MLQKKRKRRYIRKKIIIFSLIFLGFFGFSIYLIFISRNPLFISPLGKSNFDRIKIEKFLKNNNIQFSEIVILSDSSYSVNIVNNGQVRLSSQKDVNQQVSSLQRILKALTIEGKQFKSLDFRFSEPIISF